MSKTGLALWLILILPPTIPLYAADEDEDFNDDEPPPVSKNVQWPNGDRYYGDYVDNQRTGKGIYIWANGDRYEGEFYEGMRDGRGKYIWANGDRYEGDYMENQRDGEGTYIWANGDRFQGEFYEGKRGEGKVTRAKKPIRLASSPPAREMPTIDLNDKTTSKAEISEENSEKTDEKDRRVQAQTLLGEVNIPDDERHLKEIDDNEFLEPANQETTITGKEKISFAKSNENDLTGTNEKITEVEKQLEVTDEQVTQEEEKIVNPIIAAEGKDTQNDDSSDLKEIDKETTVTETEDLDQSDKTSVGFATIEPISVKEGTLTDRANGKMTIKWPNGDFYEGEYSGDKRTGQGVYIWANGDHYKGDFVDGERHGFGTYTWANGDRYEGEYIKDQRHGKGLYVWANGDRYSGSFSEGQRHGYGTLTWVEGDIYKGDFVEGKRTGKGVYISSGGDRYEGYFEDGKRTGKGILISANGDPNQIEFQENLYTFEELEFKGGKLVSASATGEREDDTNNDAGEEEGDNG